MTGHPQTDNNLHRWLAPISDSAWRQIEEEAARTVKRSLAARRVIDVSGPLGYSFASVTTGHVAEIAAPVILIVQNTFPVTEVGTATASNNYSRQIGASLGSAIVGSLFVAKLTRCSASGCRPAAPRRKAATIR